MAAFEAGVVPVEEHPDPSVSVFELSSIAGRLSRSEFGQSALPGLNPSGKSTIYELAGHCQVSHSALSDFPCWR